MKIFNKYSEYYDVIYKKKNYLKETNYVLSHLKKKPKNILDIGCGTGGHLSYFSKKKIDTVGVDSSKQMISIAKKKNPGLKFIHSDAKSFLFRYKFDLITSLFHVTSYINKDKDLLRIFKNVKKHLNKNGTYIFDYWYREAVKKDKPYLRVKKFYIKNSEFIKISEPYFDKKLKEIDLNFYLIEKKKGKKQLFTEKHFMRSYNPYELFKILKLAGFKKMFAYEWLSNKNVNKNNWNACIVARI